MRKALWSHKITVPALHNNHFCSPQARLSTRKNWISRSSMIRRRNILTFFGGTQLIREKKLFQKICRHIQGASAVKFRSHSINIRDLKEFQKLGEKKLRKGDSNPRHWCLSTDFLQLFSRKKIVALDWIGHDYGNLPWKYWKCDQTKKENRYSFAKSSMHPKKRSSQILHERLQNLLLLEIFWPMKTSNNPFFFLLLLFFLVALSLITFIFCTFFKWWKIKRWVFGCRNLCQRWDDGTAIPFINLVMLATWPRTTPNNATCTRTRTHNIHCM